MSKLKLRKNQWKLDKKTDQKNVFQKRYSLHFGQNP